jgi:hypothetical protein
MQHVHRKLTRLRTDPDGVCQVEFLALFFGQIDLIDTRMIPLLEWFAGLEPSQQPSMATNAFQRKLTPIHSARVKGHSRLMGELLLSGLKGRVWKVESPPLGGEALERVRKVVERAKRSFFQ